LSSTHDGPTCRRRGARGGGGRGEVEFKLENNLSKDEKQKGGKGPTLFIVNFPYFAVQMISGVVRRKTKK
jgi:hypothetical protein